MVFEPEAAPKQHEEFIAWCTEQTESVEGTADGDPSMTSERLRNWFSEIIATFPPLNGPFAGAELPEDEARATDYEIRKESIYLCFRWSKMAMAYQTVFDLAAKHGVGFFNASSDNGEVWLPEHGKLVLASADAPKSLIGRIRQFIRAMKALP